MDLKSLLSQKISFQSDTWSSISKEITIGEVLEEIKGIKLKKIVEQLRLLFLNDLEAYKVEKLKLPAVTFCGTFDGLRQKERLKNYNNVIVLDIDKLSEELLQKVRKELNQDEFTFTFWTSPSNYGIKGLVALEFNFEITKENRDNAHRSAFIKLSKYFKEKYEIELDNSGSDTPRLCFLSYDEGLVLKGAYRAFLIEESDLQISVPTTDNSERNIRITNKKDKLYNPTGKNKNIHRQAIKFLIKYLTKNNISITSEYENWYRVAYAIANTFTFDLGQKYFLELSKLDGLKYNETACINMLTYCYENSNGGIKYTTIEYLAKQNGYVNRIIREGAFRSEA